MMDSTNTCHRCGYNTCECSGGQGLPLEESLVGQWQPETEYEPTSPTAPLSDPEEVPEDVEDFAAVHTVKSLKRNRTFAEKQPMSAQPDLHDFFDLYGTTLPKRITLCRSYASYLASRMPPKRARK